MDAQRRAPRVREGLGNGRHDEEGRSAWLESSAKRRQMLEDAPAGKFDVVVTHTLTGSPVTSGHAGRPSSPSVTYVSITQDIDYSTPASCLTMLGAFAQYLRRTVRPGGCGSGRCRVVPRPSAMRCDATCIASTRPIACTSILWPGTSGRLFEKYKLVRTQCVAGDVLKTEDSALKGGDGRMAIYRETLRNPARQKDINSRVVGARHPEQPVRC